MTITSTGSVTNMTGTPANVGTTGSVIVSGIRQHGITLFNVGQRGTGSLLIENGGTVYEVNVATNAASIGNVTDRPSSTLNTSITNVIGLNGTAISRKTAESSPVRASKRKRYRHRSGNVTGADSNHSY